MPAYKGEPQARDSLGRHLSGCKGVVTTVPDYVISTRGKRIARELSSASGEDKQP